MYPDPNMPDPRAALAAYGPPPQADMVIGLDEAQANDPAQGPDPRAALAAYSGQPMPDTSMQAVNQQGNAIADQQASNNLRAQVAQDAANQAAAVQAESATNAAMQADELRMAREEHAGEVAKLTDEGEDIGKRSTMSRVMSTVAVALGGMQDQNNLVAGLKQGLNVQTDNAKQISDMINTQIERDINLQREKLAGKRGAESQGYAENVQAMQLAHAAKIEQAQMALQSIASRAQGEDEQASILGANARLEEKKQALFGATLKEREAAKARAAAAGSGKQRAIDWGSFTPEQLKSMAEAGVLPADGLKVLQGVTPDAPVKAASDAKAQEKLAAQERVIGLVDQIKAVRKANPVERGLPGWLPGVDAPAEIDALSSQLDLEIKKAKELGTLDKGSVEFLENMRGDATAWSSNADTKLDVMKRTAEEERARLGGGQKSDLPSGVQANLNALRSKHSFKPTGQ